MTARIVKMRHVVYGNMRNHCVCLMIMSHMHFSIILNYSTNRNILLVCKYILFTVCSPCIGLPECTNTYFKWHFVFPFKFCLPDYLSFWLC